MSFVEVKYHLNLPISFRNSSLRIVPMPVKQPWKMEKYEMKFSEYNQKKGMPKKNPQKKHLHVLWVILFIKSGKGIDSVTVSLHNPNGRVRAFQGDCQWPLKQRKFPTVIWAYNPLWLRQSQHMLLSANHKVMILVNYRTTDSPTATRFGLCSSLARASELGFCYQAMVWLKACYLNV